MVRKDPLNERGPAPAGGREKVGWSVRMRTPQHLFQLQPYEEYRKIWEHALVGASSFIGLLEIYSELDMPGIPTEQLKGVAARLLQIVEREENGRETPPTSTDVPR